MVVLGDARRIPLKDRSVQCVVTSPPYWGQRNYGVAGQLGLEPTPQEYVAAMVQVFREVRRVLKDDGTLWLVLGDSYSHAGRAHRDAERWPKQAGNGHFPGRVKQNTGAKPKDLLGLPWEVALALRRDGWTLRSDIIWQKPCAMPEAVKDRPTRSHEHVFQMSKSETYYYEKPTAGDRDVWTIDRDRKCRHSHLAAFPTQLVERCVLRGSRPGDLILDPFLGSGTTGLVANHLKRRWVGLDLNLAHARRSLPRYTHQQILEIMGCDEIADCA